MNRNQLILLIVAVAIIGGAGLLLSSKQDAGWKAKTGSEGKPILGTLPVNDVAQVVIKQADGQVTLTKKDDGWRVKERGDYAANFGTISEFIRKAAEWKAVQTEPIGASQLGRMKLLPPDKGADSGTLVEFHDKGGKVLSSVILGKPYVKKQESEPSPFGGEPPAAGRFVLVQSQPGMMSLLNESLSHIEPKPADWLDKEFFSVSRPKAVTFTSPVATNSWAVKRENDNAQWELLDVKPGEDFDKNKNAGIAGPLASISFTDVVAPDTKPETLGMDAPTVVKVETFDTFTYTIKIGKLTGENYPMNVTVTALLNQERTPGKDEKPEDKEKLEREFKDSMKAFADKLANEKKLEKWTYLVSKWSLEPLLKDRAALMVEKKDEKKEGEKANP